MLTFADGVSRCALMSRLRICTYFAIILSVASCSYIPRDPSFTTLSGTISYRERVSLVPEAVVVVQLLDLSAGGKESNIIGEERLERPGQVPIRFNLKYDANAIANGHRYGVTARIFSGRRLLFATHDPYPVVVGGKSRPVDLVLERAPAPVDAPFVD